MIVLRYNADKFDPEEMTSYYKWLKETTKEEVIALPTDWDILFNCSTADLYGFIEHIKEIIRQKEVANED